MIDSNLLTTLREKIKLYSNGYMDSPVFFHTEQTLSTFHVLGNPFFLSCLLNSFTKIEDIIRLRFFREPTGILFEPVAFAESRQEKKT